MSLVKESAKYVEAELTRVGDVETAGLVAEDWVGLLAPGDVDGDSVPDHIDINDDNDGIWMLLRTA